MYAWTVTVIRMSVNGNQGSRCVTGRPVCYRDDRLCGTYIYIATYLHPRPGAVEYFTRTRIAAISLTQHWSAIQPVMEMEMEDQATLDLMPNNNFSRDIRISSYIKLVALGSVPKMLIIVSAIIYSVRTYSYVYLT